MNTAPFLSPRQSGWHPPEAAKPPVSATGWQWQAHGTLGFIAALLATLVAVQLTPDEVQAAGHLRLSAAILAFGLLIVPFRVMFTSPASLFHPVPLVAASPVYWLLLDLLQGTYDLEHVTQYEVRRAFFCIGLFSSCVWLGALFKPWRLPRMVRSAATLDLSHQALFGIGLIAFLLAFLRFAIPSGFDIGTMLGAFQGNRWSAPWARGALGGWDAFLDHLGYFGYLVPPMTAYLARKAGWFHWRTIVLVILSFMLLALFSTSGGRRIVGVMVGSGLVVWFFSAQRPGLKTLAGLALCGAGLLIFLQMMLMYRGVGMAAAFSEETQIEESEEHLHVDDNFLRLAQTIKIIPDLHPHAGTQWLVWVVVRPVPRVLWPGKPVDPGFDLPTFLGKQGVSLTMSLVGELFMAFGFLGCAAGGIFVGFLARNLAQVMQEGAGPGAIILFGSGLLALFAGMRSAIDLVLMSYGVLAWIALAAGYRTLRGDNREFAEPDLTLPKMLPKPEWK